jgi:hypothetical protein
MSHNVLTKIKLLIKHFLPPVCVEITLSEKFLTSAGKPAILTACRGLSLNVQANTELVDLQIGHFKILFIQSVPENGRKSCPKHVRTFRRVH